VEWHCWSAFFKRLGRLQLGFPGLYGGRGHDSSSCLAEPFRFIVLTYLISALIAVNWLGHFFSRIPVTRILHCPRRYKP
jgi:hypothetical protein